MGIAQVGVGIQENFPGAFIYHVAILVRVSI